MSKIVKDGETILFYGYSTLIKNMIISLHHKKKVRRIDSEHKLYLRV